MYRVTRILNIIANRPLEAIEFCVALVLFFTGLWLVSPFYVPANSTSAKVAGTVNFPLYFGIFQILVSSFFFYILARFSWLKREMMRRRLTFTIFLVLSFYAISGAMVNGLTRISWMTVGVLALITGVCHIALAYKMEDAKRSTE